MMHLYSAPDTSSNANTNYSASTITITITNMCKSTTKLCTACTSMFTKWDGCELFNQFKIKSGTSEMKPNATAWITQHGMKNASDMQNKIVISKCVACKRTNKPKIDNERLIAAVEKATSELAGTFMIVNEDDKKIAGPWLKTTRTSNPPVTDTETETETETEGDTETELDTDNDVTHKLKIGTK